MPTAKAFGSAQSQFNVKTAAWPMYIHLVNKCTCCRSSHRFPPPHFKIDGCLAIESPAAGWQYGSSLNNVGSNGNYWSATPNGSNNAWYLNFNSGGQNVNNNNRNNGHSVRPVLELTNPCRRQA